MGGYTVKKVLTYLFIIFNSFVCALAYQLIVFPNHFAPAGVGGICTMIQYVFDFSIGYMTLLINIPLAIAVYFLVSRYTAVRAMTYSLFFAIFSLLLERLDLRAFQYVTENSAILGPLVGGIIMGWSCAMLLKVSSHQAGLYFISSLIRKWRPDFNFSWVSFSLNIVVAFISYFVYDNGIEPVLLCILYFFASSMVNDLISKGGRAAVRFEIVTDDPDRIRAFILEEVHHSATVLPGKGIYQGKETNVVVCVVNKSQAAMLSAILRREPGTFAIVSQVTDVIGNFKHLDNRGHQGKQLLDVGDAAKQ